MRLVAARLFAIGALLAMGPAALAAAAELAAQQAPADQQAEQNPEETAEPEDTTADKTPETATEDKRICRYVKLDMSSRRKTKVCRTVEEWREINNPR
jgi:hypothetical protein